MREPLLKVTQSWMTGNEWDLRSLSNLGNVAPLAAISGSTVSRNIVQGFSLSLKSIIWNAEMHKPYCTCTEKCMHSWATRLMLQKHTYTRNQWRFALIDHIWTIFLRADASKREMHSHQLRGPCPFHFLRAEKCWLCALKSTGEKCWMIFVIDSC